MSLTGQGGGDAFAAIRRMALEARLRKVGQQAGAGPTGGEKLWERAAAKVRGEALLTREETAAYLGVSTKMLQRMEGRGELRRCPGLGSVVRYSASDVLRLATGRRKGA